MLSISTNSASCERLFSLFGHILTKLRNRLGLENMKMIAELKMHVRDRLRNSSNTHARLKRHFSSEPRTAHANTQCVILVADPVDDQSLADSLTVTQGR